MDEELQFKISSGLKNIIGRDLITDDFIAIFELVKNSYDAHADKVVIEFENLQSQNALIRITDNGKGMSYSDLINKWLFVAYSAKKDGTEDLDYRNKIQNRTFYAGAKGIGRFSCDKLGSKLKLITTKVGENSATEQIKVNWDDFEQDSKDEFINIGVNHATLKSNPSIFQVGTVLEITGLRKDSNWDYQKLLKLKSSLSKLINPFESNEKRVFNIEIKADEYLNEDRAQDSENRRVNGLIRNNLLNLLDEKTIKIRSEITKTGNRLKTEISNNGIWLFTITEENLSFNLLKNVFIELFYLNRSAKNNFTRTMGIRNTQYGSVFLYKNGIRVYPYGEPGIDPLELDKRQQNRLGDRLGTQQLIGRIEISGLNEDFKETTSRDGGLIKNQAYYQLLDYFINTLERLEFFWTSIFKYGINTSAFGSNENIELQIVKRLTKTNSQTLSEITFNENLISLITDTQNDNENALTLIKSIERIAADTENLELISKINKVKNTLDDALTIAELAEEEIKVKDKEIKEKETQNLFLKSVKSQDFEEVVSFLHHIGISSKNIDNNLKLLVKRIRKGKTISNTELVEIIQKVIFENRKILSISKFASKANFQLYTSTIEVNVVEYIIEYINNILGLVKTQKPIIHIKHGSEIQFIKDLRPIELNIIIDNLISNSRRAKAENVYISFSLNKDRLVFKFADDGAGIKDDISQKIFDFGFTTTSGSGIGLYHIKKMITEMNGSINLNVENKKFTEFVISIGKNEDN